MSRWLRGEAWVYAVAAFGFLWGFGFGFWAGIQS